MALRHHNLDLCKAADGCKCTCVICQDYHQTAPTVGTGIIVYLPNPRHPKK